MKVYSQNMCQSRSGQSLVEILVAVAVGVTILGSVLVLIWPTLKTGKDVERIQTAGALGKELMENIGIVADREWSKIGGLATTSANTYHIVASTSPFSVATGTEDVLIGTTTYTRYFYIEDVYRDGSGLINTSGVLHDPSTEKVTVIYVWPGNASNSMVHYLTRSRNAFVIQGDWMGGPGGEGPIAPTSTTNLFSTSSSIDYSTSGVISIFGI